MTNQFSYNPSPFQSLGYPVGHSPIQNQSPQGYTQQTQASYNIQPVIRARAVTGAEEAKAAEIPFDNSISVFLDFSNGAIYTKRFNFQDGSAILQTYKVEKSAPPATTPSQQETKFAPIEELNILRKEFEDFKIQIATANQPKPQKNSQIKEGE